MFDIFGVLVPNILPLYALIALGYAGGRWMDVNLPSMATVAIYLVAPIVNFGAMTKLEFDPRYIVLPLLFFGASVTIGLSMYQAASLRWKSNMANLIALGSVSGNTGYFGMPIILGLFGAEWVGLYLFMNLSLLLSEVTLGYYLGARGNADMKSALKKVVRLPVLHAVWLGLLTNFLGFELPAILDRYWTYSTGAWVFIGMMLIGVALSKQGRLDIDARLTGWMFFPKFVLWPLTGAVVIMLDLFALGLFDETVYQMIVVFTSVPLAGNVVAYASNLRLHPEKAAATVLVSTFFAILTVPGALTIFRMLYGE